MSVIKIPYRNHARRHLPGGSDPIAFTAGGALTLFEQRKSGSAQTITSATGFNTSVTFATTDNTTIDPTDLHTPNDQDYYLSHGWWLLNSSLTFNFNLGGGLPVNPTYAQMRFEHYGTTQRDVGSTFHDGIQGVNVYVASSTLFLSLNTGSVPTDESSDNKIRVEAGQHCGSSVDLASGQCYLGLIKLS